MCRHSITDNDEFCSRLLLTSINHLSFKPVQILRRLRDLWTPQLDFDSDPRAIALVYHGVNFQIVGVVVV